MTRRGYVPSCSRLLLAVLCLALWSLGFSGNAGAATLTVNTTTDSSDPSGSCTSSGTCSLRDAITQASAGDIINFSVTGTITLGSALPAIAQNLTIQGPTTSNGITVSGDNKYTVFTISSGTVNISNLTIANGKASDGSGISNSGTLTVMNSTFSGNSASVYGGAIYDVDPGQTTVVNSTFSGNSASGDGGAISSNVGTVTIVNSTFSGNTASSGGGGAIYNADGTLTVENSILSGDSDECDGSGGCPTNGSDGNVVGVAANLAALGNYGGPTQTMLPQPGSPAICAGSASLVPSGVSKDQRGFTIGASTYCTSGKIDSGSVQTDYTSVQFTNPSTTLPGYAALVSQPVAFPAAPIVSVTENTMNQGGIPVTLTFTGSGTPSGLGPETTVAGTGATFGSVSVTEAGSGTFGVSLTIVGSTKLTASADLKVVSITLTPAAGVLPGATENRPYTATFSASGGTTSTYTYSESGTLPAGLTFSAGSATLSGTPTSTGSSSFSVTATDSNGFAGTQNYTLTVNSPVTATVAKPSVALTANHAAASFTPVTGSNGTTPLTYSISPALPSGLSMSSSTGAITGTPAAASAAMSYTVTVTDFNGSTASQNFALSVNGAVAATQAVSSETLTANHAATPFTPVTGAGGTGTLSYSISPALPTGLSISSSTGAITGTPTAASAAKSYTVTVTDTNSATATASFMLTVNSAVAATVSVASETLTANHAAASFTPVTGSGGTGTLSYSISPALPGGLNINSSTGAITGTPTAASITASYTVTVTDTNSATATASFNLTVNSAVAAAVSVPSVTLTANHAATSFTPVTGSGGTGTLNYSISPALPAGLSINSSTGAITGTPTGASPAASYTVTVTDTNNATATASFSLTVNSAVVAPRSIAAETLTASQSAASFTPVTGSGGTGTLSYSIAPALPSGLSINSSTGAITGSPTVASAAANYTITVADANSATASATFSLTVNNAVTATSIGTETLTVNGTASFTPVTGSGGTAPLAYSVSPALPSGLSINSSTGQITGTLAAVSAATSYTVTVTDVNQVSATASFTLTVNPAATAVSVSSSSTGNTSNVNTSVTFTATITAPAGQTRLAGKVTFTSTPANSAVSACALLPIVLSSSTQNGMQSATATCTVSSLTVAGSPYTISAAYGSDTNFSNASGSSAQTIKPAATSTMVVSSPNPSIVLNPSNYNDKVLLTATVGPSSGTVPLSGAVTFTDNGAPISECLSAVPVNTSTGIATCTTTSLSAGTHTIQAAYNSDPNYTGSSSTTTQNIQDYTLTLASSGSITITQYHTNSTDPFATETVTASASTIDNFTGNLTLSCNIIAVSVPSNAVLPKCELSNSTLSIPTSNTINVTIDAGAGSTPVASPGTYNISIVGVDATTGLTHATASLPFNIQFEATPLNIVSGATTGNSTTAEFVLPANVGLSSLECASVTGPTLTSSVAPIALSMACTFSPTSIAAASTSQTASVTVTINTNATATAKLNDNGNNATIVFAGVIGIPIFVLLGFIPGGRSSRKMLIRFMGIAFVAVLILQGTGCGGGKFTAPKSVSGLTPPGSYILLVQGTGTDNQTYQSVIQVNVTR